MADTRAETTRRAATPAEGDAAGDPQERIAQGDADARAGLDEAYEKGYWGTVPDPTPDKNYSLETVEFETPETDPKLAAEVGSRKFTGTDAERERTS